MRLLKLELRNFQGVSHFVLDAKGEDVSVFGDNATGKTTLVTAMNFLLFGKNYAFKTDFEIKTLMESGESKHGFEHEVEAVLDLEDGSKPLTLKRSYHEKWQKKRGSADSQFTGHETDFHIDGVPVKKQEYEARIADMSEEQTFRLLTSPDYFNVHLHWERRRELLLTICGEVSDQEVIASNDDLKLLPEILGDRTLENHKRVIAAKRAEINRELQSLPIRIDEVSQGLPATSGNQEHVETELKKLREQVQDKHQEKARLTDGGEVAQKTKRLRELEAEMQAHRSKARSTADEINREARARADEANQAQRHALHTVIDQIEDLERQIASMQQGIESNQSIIALREKTMASLRDKWEAINAESFADGTETTCAACGQDLPAERVQEARDKALALFNSGKAKRLEDVDAEGKQAKTEAANLALLNEQHRKDISQMEEQRAKLEAEKPPLPESVEPEVVEPDLSASEALLVQVEALEAEIAQLGEGNTGSLAAVTDAISDLQQQIRDHEAALAVFDQVEHGNERIEDLKAQEKKLGKKFEELERQLFLCETFIKTKVGMLEEKINGKFELARFKLFNELINGGLEECCDTTYLGIPFADLNGAAKINIGLDIIRTLAEHYQFQAPVWIDNSESVVELLPLESQVVRLVVSGDDKALRVETKTKETVTNG